MGIFVKLAWTIHFRGPLGKPRAHLTNAPAILALYLERRGLRSFSKGGVMLAFGSLLLIMCLYYRSAYVFVWLCLDMHIVHVVSLCHWT